MTDTMPTVTGLLLKADGTIENKTYSCYEDLKSAVGGWIEGIDPLAGAMMFKWRGYGKPIGSPIVNDAKPNTFATIVLTAAGWTGGPLAGDVVVVGPTDDEGWETDLDPEIAQGIRDAYTELGYLADGWVTPEVED